MFRMFFISIFVSLNLLALPQDTVLLNEIVLNTAAELNELEQLLSNSEKYTEKFYAWAKAVDETKYKIERIEMWTNDLLMTPQKVTDLRSLNDTLRRIRLLKQEAEDISREYAIEESVSKEKQRIIEDEYQSQKDLAKKYKDQALRGNRGGTEALQTISRNTSAEVYESSKTNLLLLEVNKNLLKVIEVMSKDKKRKELSKSEKEKFYKLDNSTKN